MKPLLLVIGFAAAAAFGLSHHEMWRDEYQAWLVARDAHSILQLFENLRYEGNPALWHLLLFGVKALTPDPRSMQVLNYLFAVAAVAVIAFRSPFPWVWRVLLVFGYYSLFEFTLMSRSYALGFFLTALACAWFPTRHSRPIRLAVVLALLAYTHVFGQIIAMAIGLVAAADVFLPGLAAPEVSGRMRALFLAIVLAGSVASAIQIYPEADNSFPTKRPAAGLDVRRVVESVADVSRSYLPIPAIDLPHWWNTNVLDFVRPNVAGWTPTRLEAPIGLALVLIFLWSFRKQPAVAAAYLAGTAGLLAIKYLTGMGLQRYIGHSLVMLVAAMWLSRATSWRGTIAAWTFTVVMAAGCVGGILAWSADIRTPFSGSTELVRLIKAEQLDGDEIIAIADHASSPVSAELHRQVFFPQLGRDGSFAIWSGERREVLDPAALVQQIATIVNRSERHRAVLVFNVPSVDVLSPIVPEEPNGVVPLGDGMTMRPVFHVPMGVVIGEEYWCYLVERR